MTGKPVDEARAGRLAAALRENLRRRKAQARASAAVAGDTAADAMLDDRTDAFRSGCHDDAAAGE